MLARAGRAKDYGPNLVSARFLKVMDDSLGAGDVVVIDSFKGNAFGHMAMYDGTTWISDFVQRDLYPGPSYRQHKPAYTVYRYAGVPWDSIVSPSIYSNVS